MRRTDNSTAKRHSSDIRKVKDCKNSTLDSDDSFTNRYSNDTNKLGESGSDSSFIIDDYALQSPLINNNHDNPNNSNNSTQSVDRGNFYRGAPTTGFRTSTLTDWHDDEWLDDDDDNEIQFEDEVIVYR
jgi:hypothetical protein